jgi:ornithine cyclodeaminase/alanine dehydrogenase-like protein (mu-crystallin family)
VLYLSEREVKGLLPIGDVIAALESAFRAQAQGGIRLPLRSMASNDRGLLGAMPGAIVADPASLGAKLVAVFADNAALGLHTHQALIILFDTACGLPLAVMDGRFITEIRTAATSALATKALARADARTLAVLGTGVQARAHIEAIAEVIDIDELRVWGRTTAKAATLADFGRKRGLHARVAASPTDACRGAAVVCTVTAASEPILATTDVDHGTHINAVGFRGPTSREMPGELMARARIFVDSLEGAHSESGNIILAMREGLLSASTVLTPLCDVMDARSPGRRSPDDITIFDSLGIAIEDLACARLVYDRAKAAGVGTRLDL